MFYSSKKLKSNKNFIKNDYRYINRVRGKKKRKRKEEREVKALFTIECQLMNVEEWLSEKLLFCSHHHNNWFRQESSMDAKAVSKICSETDYLHSLKPSPQRLLIHCI